MSDYVLHLGDCLEEMNRIEDGSVDMILADLPYGTTACKWDVIIPFEPLWAHYKRVIKKRGAVVLFGSQPFTSMLIMSNLNWFRDEWIWEKDKATRHLDSKIRPLKAHESVLVFGRELPNYYPQKTEGHKIANYTRGRIKGGNFYQLMRGGLKPESGKWGHTDRYPRSVQKFNCPNHGEMGLAPTQKPVALLEYLIKTYTNPGELVLDNVFGSCSTGEACLRTGRRFIGIEKDEGYYQIGAERMERVAAELRGEYIPKPAKGKIEDLPMFAEVAV